MSISSHTKKNKISLPSCDEYFSTKVKYYCPVIITKRKTPFSFPESTIFINIIPSGCVDRVNTIVLNVITRRISRNILVEVLMQCEISRFLTIKALPNHEIKSSTIF